MVELSYYSRRFLSKRESTSFGGGAGLGAGFSLVVSFTVMGSRADWAIDMGSWSFASPGNLSWAAGPSYFFNLVDDWPDSSLEASAAMWLLTCIPSGI